MEDLQQTLTMLGITILFGIAWYGSYQAYQKGREDGYQAALRATSAPSADPELPTPPRTS